MAFNLVAILKNKEHSYNFEILKKSLSEYLPYTNISFREGCPPLLDPHLIVNVDETDFGDKGNWNASVFIENDETIAEANKELILQDDSNRPDKKEIMESSSRIRILFRDDHDQLYTNTMIDLVSFLESIPDSALFDYAQNKFL